MKTSNHLLFAALLALAVCSEARANVILSDSFDGPLDPAKWQVALPLDRSSVAVGNGVCNSMDRGILAAIPGLSQPYVINGAFQMHDSIEHFDIAIRTDLSAFGVCCERSGIIITFVNDGDGICIQQYTANSTDWQQLAWTPYDLHENETYFFSIKDDGFNVSVAVNGVDLLATSSDYATGSQAAFYSREIGGGTSIESVDIQFVPDITSSAALLVIGMLGLMGLRRCVQYEG